MSEVYNIYCDESCHLEHDGQAIMVLGAIWCPIEKTRDASVRICEIKKHHNLADNFEIKWVKVSPAKIDFYMDLLDYFFDDDDLHFRGLVANKANLNHLEHNQTHEDWYYKMYFDMLKVILFPHSKYRIYLDIKDTKSKFKVQKLREVLCNNMYDFSREIIERTQTVRSHEINLLQLTDLLVGIISYANRKLQSSEAKLTLLRRMRERSRYKLTNKTLYLENKVNLFFWEANWNKRDDQ